MKKKIYDVPVSHGGKKKTSFIIHRAQTTLSHFYQPEYVIHGHSQPRSMQDVCRHGPSLMT